MTPIQYRVSLGLAALFAATVAAQIGLSLHNGARRGDIQQRQQYVQQSVPLEGLYRDMVRALAELAARGNDGDVRSMLQRHGISYNVAPAAEAAPRKQP